MPGGYQFLRGPAFESGQRLVSEPDDRLGRIAAEQVACRRDDASHLPSRACTAGDFGCCERLLRWALAIRAKCDSGTRMTPLILCGGREPLRSRSEEHTSELQSLM